MATTTKATAIPAGAKPATPRAGTAKETMELWFGVQHGPIAEGIERCLACEAACERALAAALRGKRPEELLLVKTLQDCAETCRSTVAFLLRGSPAQQSMCGLCVEVCEICAFRCVAAGGMEAILCSEACRDCAMTCRTLTRGLM